MIKKVGVFFPYILMFHSLGCGLGFETKTLRSESSYFESSSSTDFFRSQEKLNPLCRSEGELCVFLKNPVAQTQTLYSSESAPSELQAQQIFQVKLNGLDQSGWIKNDHFDVKSVDGSRATLEEVVLSRGQSDRQKTWLIANAYFWLNRTYEFLRNNFKDFPLKNERVEVYVDDAFNGWSMDKKSLHLKGKKLSALSADVVLALYGEALIGAGSGGAIYNFDSQFHRSCGGDPNGCCASSKGCAKALVQASGDVLVNFLFEDLSGVGEFYHQSLKGQSICGRSRRPQDFLAPNFEEVFLECEEKGKISAMATAYAACWYGLKKDFELKKVLEVYLKHLSELNGSDTFESAFAKASRAATSLGYMDLAKRYESLFPVCGPLED